MSIVFGVLCGDTGTGGRIEIWQPGCDLATAAVQPMTYKGALHAGS